MLTSKKPQTSRTRVPFYYKAISLRAANFRFPFIEGLEDISTHMASVTAEDLFSALLKGYDLSPITTEERAKKAERFLEYLLRAFDKRCPAKVKSYIHVLEMLIDEYDQQHATPAVQNLPPHKLLEALLAEAGLAQKVLVPNCFKSASQVSEFLHQKKGRSKLTADQAMQLGKRFHISPLLFLV